MFEDRHDGGQQLAELIGEHDIEADIVLAIPRGGLPVGRAVADRLGVPLDVIVAKKMGAPGNPELAIGAVAADGSVWLNDDLVDRLGIDEAYVEREREQRAGEAREKLRRYRGDGPDPEFEGERVVVVDDGIATGATAIACLRQVRAAGANRIVLAVPVGAPESVEMLRAEADEVLCVETPPNFSAVGQFYRSFEQVPDEEALTYLRRDE